MLRINVLNSFNENNPLTQTNVRFTRKGRSMPRRRMSSHMRTLFQKWSVRQEISWYVLKNRVAKESKFTLSFLVMKLGVGNLIFGTQKPYHKTNIPMFIRAERSYWRIVVIFSYFWERRIQMITTQWEPWSVAAGGSEMIWESYGYYCHINMFY